MMRRKKQSCMTDRIKQILDNIYKYNKGSLAEVNFGLTDDIVYDALIVAPSYSPYIILKDDSYKVTELGGRSYSQGFLVEKDELKLAWIKTAAGGCNMLDYLLICGELRFNKLIFIGAVGALRQEFDIGDICTPSYSVAGTMANTYLRESLRDYVPFEQIYPDREHVEHVVKMAAESGYRIREASVFCTDSIVMEYTHLDEIRAFGTDLIEMETSTFYAIAKLMDIPAIALLVVSDNSATGVPLVGRSGEIQERYERARCVILPELICRISRM